MCRDAWVNNEVYLWITLEGVAILIFDLKLIAFREERNLSKVGKNTLVWYLTLYQKRFKKCSALL